MAIISIISEFQVKDCTILKFAPITVCLHHLFVFIKKFHNELNGVLYFIVKYHIVNSFYGFFKTL